MLSYSTLYDRYLYVVGQVNVANEHEIAVFLHYDSENITQ